MKALSLTRPWPYTILHLGKRIENRKDKRGMPPMCLYRGELWLHSAKSWDTGVGAWCKERGLGDATSRGPLYVPKGIARDEWHPPGAIVGRCRVVGRIEPDYQADMFDGGTAPFRVVGEHARDLDMRWWMGGFALVLADVVPITPIVPCKGALGIWTIPSEVQATLAVRRGGSGSGRYGNAVSAQGMTNRRDER